MSAAAQIDPADLLIRLQTDPPGVIEVPSRPDPLIVIHVGPSVRISCTRVGRRHSGLSTHGDVDIIPAGVPSRWEVKEKDTALILGIPSHLLRAASEVLDRDPDRVEIVNRFQTRDRQIEHLGWALKSELEAGYPNGRLYRDSLTTALAVHLLNHHSTDSRETGSVKGGLSGRRLRNVIAYIEENLTRDLSLQEIAGVAGLSVSYCKTAFRESVGQPVHRYVIERRVERARMLLSDGDVSISQAALETGFAHQSHLAHHMRRLLGVSPKEVRRLDR
jgi:AraC family transcriptional regulator